MEGTPHNNVPKQDTEDANFVPKTNLNEHFQGFAKLASSIRGHADPMLQRLTEITDIACYRSAMRPQGE